MSRILIDPEELAALSALCRNTSYDVADVATELRYRVEHVSALLQPADAARVAALANAAVHTLHRVAVQLDDDAQAVALFGQRGAAADALGGLSGHEHDLLARLQGNDQ